MNIFIFFSIIISAIVFAFCTYGVSAIMRRHFKEGCRRNKYYSVQDNTKMHFEPQYVVYTVFFLLFEAVIMLLFPYALVVSEFSFIGLAEVSFFILIFLFGLLFAIKSNILRSK